MEEEEDDFYTQNADAPVKNELPADQDDPNPNHQPAIDLQPDQDDDVDHDDADDDDDEEDDDSDIDIITEHKDGAAPDPPQARPFRGIKPEAPARTASLDAPNTQQSQQIPTPKTESSPQNKKLVSLKDGSKYPQVRTSSIDVNATPSWDPAGKLITEVDIDADLAEHTKPWRLPGTDQTDFFNYGFDEFTWTQYCLRQQNMASTINNQKVETKQFEMMLTGGAMPGQAPPAGPQAPTPAGPMAMGMPAMGMPGMPDMNPDNMAAFASLLQSQGIDPSQLDFNTFMQHYQQASMGAGQAAYNGQSMQPQQQQNQGYGGQQQQSFQQQANGAFRGATPQPGQQGPQAQGQGFDGYSQQQIAMMQGQGGIPSGPSGGGRGRGRGRRW